MTKENLLKLRLQMFAEDPPADKDPGTDEGGQEDDKTVNVAEMKRRIEQEKQRAEAEKAKLLAQQEAAIADAVAKATLSGKELDKYKEEEAKRKEDTYKQRIAELELENTRRDLKDQAIKTLSEKKLPVNDKLLSFVVKDTAEETLKAIDDMAELLSEQKNVNAATPPPRTGGGLGEPKSKDVFTEAKITGF